MAAALVNLETQTADQAELVRLLEKLSSRIEHLEKEVTELTQWLTEVADDLLDREGVA